VSTPKEHPPEHSPPLTNDQIAACLEELADLLEAQGANLFRVRAYRTAAHNLRDLPRPATFETEVLPPAQSQAKQGHHGAFAKIKGFFSAIFG